MPTIKLDLIQMCKVWSQIGLSRDKTFRLDWIYCTSGLHGLIWDDNIRIYIKPGFPRVQFMYIIFMRVIVIYE